MTGTCASQIHGSINYEIYVEINAGFNVGSFRHFVGIPGNKILTLCDNLRDEQLIELGVKLEDTEGNYVPTPKS